MFYLLSALAMPFREAYRRARGRGAAAGWRVVAEQVAIAGGIVAGLWATGWFLGAALAAARPIVAFVGRGHVGNVLRIATFVLTFGTLAGVLAGVEVLRLWLAPRAGASPEHRQVRRPRRRVVAAGLWLACVGVAADPRPASGQHPMQVATRLAAADSALRAGNAAAAAQEYAAVIATDPSNSRAVYRLAELRRDDPAEALRLFRRYVDLEPSDPWGYMAVGDVLATVGRYRDALQWYDDALRLAPDARDAVVGRAHVLAQAGRTGAPSPRRRQLGLRLEPHAAPRGCGRARGRGAPTLGRAGDAGDRTGQH